MALSEVSLEFKHNPEERVVSILSGAGFLPAWKNVESIWKLSELI